MKVGTIEWIKDLSKKNNVEITLIPKDKALEFYEEYKDKSLIAFAEMKNLFKKYNAVFIFEYWEEVEKELKIIVK